MELVTEILCTALLGANWFIRKIVGVTSPELDVTHDGNKFVMKLHSLYMTKEMSFTVNEEYDEAHMVNGALMKVFKLLNTTLHSEVIMKDYVKLKYCF